MAGKKGTITHRCKPRNVPGISDQRRENMRRIRSESSVERLLRSMLHQRGYRFRKNVAGLPGRPDIVFPARRKAIFVHGCFWHQHPNCTRATVPRTRPDYWLPKLARTQERDTEHLESMASLGWSTLIVWECCVAKDPIGVVAEVEIFLREFAL